MSRLLPLQGLLASMKSRLAGLNLIYVHIYIYMHTYIHTHIPLFLYIYVYIQGLLASMKSRLAELNLNLFAPLRGDQSVQATQPSGLGRRASAAHHTEARSGPHRIAGVQRHAARQLATDGLRRLRRAGGYSRVLSGTLGRCGTAPLSAYGGPRR